VPGGGENNAEMPQTRRGKKGGKWSQCGRKLDDELNDYFRANYKKRAEKGLPISDTRKQTKRVGVVGGRSNCGDGGWDWWRI